MKLNKNHAKLLKLINDAVASASNGKVCESMPPFVYESYLKAINGNDLSPVNMCHVGIVLTGMLAFNAVPPNYREDIADATASLFFELSSYVVDIEQLNNAVH